MAAVTICANVRSIQTGQDFSNNQGTTVIYRDVQSNFKSHFTGVQSLIGQAIFYPFILQARTMTYASILDDIVDRFENSVCLTVQAPHVRQSTTAKCKTNHRRCHLRKNPGGFIIFIVLCFSLNGMNAHAVLSAAMPGSSGKPLTNGAGAKIESSRIPHMLGVERKLEDSFFGGSNSSENLTDSPTDLSTKVPTKSPSKQPTERPTASSTPSPTVKPTNQPTRSPSRSPTKLPSPLPTETLSSKPTLTPSRSPTLTPSFSPTAQPSKGPTSLPTSSPTQGPTSAPSVSPSISVEPSSSPTVTPTDFPSLLPSVKPSYMLQELEFFLVFQFDDLNEFSGKATTELEDLTSETVEATLEGSRNDDFDVSAYLSYQQPFDYETTSTQGTRNLAAKRLLQGSGWEVGIEVYVETRSATTYKDDVMRDIIARAFDSEEERRDFFNELQKRDSSFRRINSMEVMINNEEVDTALESGPASWIYIGAGIGAGALVIAVLLFSIWRRKRLDQTSYNAAAMEDRGDSVQQAPVASMIEVEPEDQDISTLGDPVYGGPTGMFTAAHVFDGDEPTNDSHDYLSAGYDYKMAYGGAGDMPSVSSAGGTKSALGTKALADDLTTDDSRVQRSASYADSSVITNTQQQGLSMFEDDNSFDQMYGEEERIEIIAPPGKLGVVIDTPLKGVPLVHAIKESSVLGTRIRIGDKLVSVDGEDTTQMSAIRVSKLISSKAMNPKRHMVFLRSAAPS